MAVDFNNSLMILNKLKPICIDFTGGLLVQPRTKQPIIL